MKKDPLELTAPLGTLYSTEYCDWCWPRGYWHLLECPTCGGELRLEQHQCFDCGS
jgi:hypothetical protein